MSVIPPLCIIREGRRGPDAAGGSPAPFETVPASGPGARPARRASSAPRKPPAGASPAPMAPSRRSRAASRAARAKRAKNLPTTRRVANFAKPADLVPPRRRRVRPATAGKSLRKAARANASSVKTATTPPRAPRGASRVRTGAFAALAAPSNPCSGTGRRQPSQKTPRRSCRTPPCLRARGANRARPTPRCCRPTPRAQNHRLLR